MDYAGFIPLPLGVSADLMYNLPPPQVVLFTPTIVASLIVLAVAILFVVYLAFRARAKARREGRLEALRMVERIVLKRGGTQEDADRMLHLLKLHPSLDPAVIVMMRETFHDEVRPLLDVTFEPGFGERMETIYFPPPRDTRRALSAQAKNVAAAVEDQKAAAAAQVSAAIMDLMDATLRPGVATRLAFEGLEGGYECIIMGHDARGINVTLPAHNDHLVSSLRQGMRIEGTLESGPSLLAFTSIVLQAVAGSLPYCRIAPWKTAWEVRKRESVRLPISLDIDFQHISTAAAASIQMSSLDKEIGALRPGKLVDISLGGCAVETLSSALFHEGDMLRFSKSLVAGNPPATLLGAIVKIDAINPEENDGCTQRLHVQFLVIDDVSQRILVRTLRQLQDVADRDEWMKAQRLMQQMRRSNIENIGSPAGSPYGGSGRKTGASVRAGAGAGLERRKGESGRMAARGGTSVMPKQTARASTRSYPKPPTRSITGGAAVPPPRGTEKKDGR